MSEGITLDDANLAHIARLRELLAYEQLRAEDAERAQAALLEALHNSIYVTARLCMELGYDKMLDADGVRQLKQQIETVFLAHGGIKQ